MSEIDKYENGALAYWTSIDGTIWHNDKIVQQLKAEVKSKTEYIQEQRDIINQYRKEIEMYKKCQGKRASKREEQLKAENEELKNLHINLVGVKECEIKELQQLKAENEILKQSEEEAIEIIADFKEVKNKLEREFIAENLEKRKFLNCLDEIEGIAKIEQENCRYNGSYTWSNILQLIKQAKEGVE